MTVHRPGCYNRPPKSQRLTVQDGYKMIYVGQNRVPVPNLIEIQDPFEDACQFTKDPVNAKSPGCQGCTRHHQIGGNWKYKVVIGFREPVYCLTEDEAWEAVGRRGDW